MKVFYRIDPFSDHENFTAAIAKEHALLTVADADGRYNPMTVSWGTIGCLWNRQVVTVYIRPERFTHEFAERSDTFSLCFFREEQANALKFCGAFSGRDRDKAEACSLTPIRTAAGEVYFREARKVFLLRKLYEAPLTEEGFVNDGPKRFYDGEGYHTVYVCEVTAELTDEKPE